MPRPIWKGAIRFGLVTVPVHMSPATHGRDDISFRLLHKTDRASLDCRRFYSEENVEIDGRDIAKGYEYEMGRFVVMTEQLVEC